MRLLFYYFLSNRTYKARTEFSYLIYVNQGVKYAAIVFVSFHDIRAMK